jgi:hypothetical protein
MGLPERAVHPDRSDEEPAEVGLHRAEGQAQEHFPLRVSSSDSEVFDIQAFTLRGDVSWYLEFDYTADGDQGTFKDRRSRTTVPHPGGAGAGPGLVRVRERAVGAPAYWVMAEAASSRRSSP